MDRVVLTPMEIRPAMKYFPAFALAALAFFGLEPSGILFRQAWSGGTPFLALGLLSVFSGAFLTPALLPWVPFRSFALKGWLVGLALISAALGAGLGRGNLTPWLQGFALLFFPLASSYIALQFTGSTTFTGMAGVKKELRYAVPIYVSAAVVSVLSSMRISRGSLFMKLKPLPLFSSCKDDRPRSRRGTSP